MIAVKGIVNVSFCLGRKVRPVATAPGSVFVNRQFRNSAWLVQTEPALSRLRLC